MQVSEEKARREPLSLPSARPHTTEITVYFFILPLAVGWKALNLTDVHKASCSLNLHI